MKTLIACYSHSGHTLKVAKALQKQINADLTQIKDEKGKWYLMNLWGALREKKVPIKPCQTDLINYERLVLCCPVWGGKTPPAINQYMSEIINVEGKEFGVFVTSGGGRSQKATIMMREYLDGQEMKFLGQMRLLSKEVEKEEYGEKFEIFAKKFV